MMPAKHTMRTFSPRPLLTPSDSNVAGGRLEPARQDPTHRMANGLRHALPATESFMRSIWQSHFAISHLYGTQPHNDGMKTLTRRLPLENVVRTVCLIAMGALFLFSVSELVRGAGGDVSVWRALALSSLYLSICLMQRRQFALSSRGAIRSSRLSEFVG
jgi:hypothetical protein